MDLYSNLILFYQNIPYFGGKSTNFIAVLAQNTFVCSCRPGLHWSAVNISLLIRKIHEACHGNHGSISSLSLAFSTKPFLILKEN